MAVPLSLDNDEIGSLLMESALSHFFVNLALAADADETLATMGMGRPHHRILTIAAFSPGITVYGMLEALRVTHQNVRLPMRLLEEEGFLEIRPGAQDRRQRELHATSKGRKLLNKLSARQRTRLERAFREAGAEDFNTFLRVQKAMLDPKDAAWIQGLGVPLPPK